MSKCCGEVKNDNHASAIGKAPARRWGILFANSLSLVVFYMSLNILSAFQTQVLNEWGISNTQYGFMSAMGLAGCAVACWVGGSISNKIGTRKLIAISAIIVFASIALFPVVLKKSYYPLYVLRFLTGLGGAGMGILTASTGQWFPSKERGLAIGVQGGLTGLAFSVDSLVAQPLMNLGLSWQSASALFIGGCCVAAGILHYVIYRDVKDIYPDVLVVDDLLEPEKHQEKEIAAPKQKVAVPVADTWAGTVRSTGFISMCIHMTANMLVVFTMAAYLPSILTGVLGFEESLIGPVLAATFIAAVISAPLGGIISDKVFKGRRWPICFISFAVCAVCCIILPYVHNFTLLTVILFVTYAAVPLENGPVWDVPLQWSKPEYHTKFIGVVLLISLLIGGVFGNVIVGAIIDLTGSALGALYTYVAVCALGMVSSVKFKV